MINERNKTSPAVMALGNEGFSLRNKIPSMNTKIGVMFPNVRVTPAFPIERARYSKPHCVITKKPRMNSILYCLTDILFNLDEKNIRANKPIIAPLNIYRVRGLIAFRFVNNILDGIADNPNSIEAIIGYNNTFF